MSCSKIFLGDLPELTYEVIKYFHNDFSTLYSCVLVNRLWCRLAIPLLWENPFSIRTRNYKHLEIYLQYLNEDIKTQLKEYKIINNSLPSNTFFNYYIFLKYLNIYKFAYSFEKWLKAINKTSPFEIRFKILNDICTALFKIFIENKIKLHTLEIEIFTLCKDTIYDNIIKLILKNLNFINNIRNLKYYGQNLSYLSINIVKDGYDNIEGSSIILQNLGQALPSKLEYLSLVLTINRSEFRIFLQNSKDTFINKLLIMQIGRDDILRYTKEFIMNEKRVKYLAIKSRYNGDLYDLEDEVKEFKLHNIKVRSFNDLSLSDNLNSNLIDYLQG
ncbi:unnamed protein product [Rhizophagus irregularis]|nr:unnamed protein product [Rhizophagus irregularis]